MIPRLTAVLAALALGAAAPAALGQSAPADKRASSQSSSDKPSSQAQKKGGLAKEDQQYFRSLAQANMAEVEAGKLAQQQASSEEVKEYGEQMVEDHGKMLEEQKKMAQSKGMQVPKQPNKEQQAAMKKLKEAKGEQFDRAFMSQMVKDHEKALKLAQDTAKNAKDPELKAMAQEAAPDIQKHLQMAKQLSDKASAGGSATRSKQSK
jgi:putative membrane protein